MISHVTNHTTQAIARLIQQFQNKTNLAALLTGTVTPLQEVEDAIWGLFTSRSLAGASGTQLDRLGTVVGQARNGLSDSDYQVQLRAKIGKNLSQGQPEQVLQVFTTITGASLVQLLEHFPAEVGLVSNQSITQAQADVALDAVQKVLPAAVKAVEIITYNPVHKFAMAGGNFNAMGFGDAGDGTRGGGFATAYRRTHKKFSCAGINPNPVYGGFGTITDLQVGDRCQAYDDN